MSKNVDRMYVPCISAGFITLCNRLGSTPALSSGFPVLNVGEEICCPYCGCGVSQYLQDFV